MTVMSFFSKSLPKIGSLEFDAKMEGMTSKSLTVTSYPVEFGVPMSDHAIINQARYRLIGSVGDSPLGFGLDDLGLMGTGLIGSAIGGVAGAIFSGVSAYLLSGTPETRGATAWAALSEMLEGRYLIELDTGLELMSRMMLVRLEQRTTPESEDGLSFVAELIQIRQSLSVVSQGVTSADLLAVDDTVTGQGAPLVNRGMSSVEVIR